MDPIIHVNEECCDLAIFIDTSEKITFRMIDAPHHHLRGDILIQFLDKSKWYFAKE